MSKEEFAQMMKKEKEVNNRLCELLNLAADTLSREFGISYYDAEHEIVKWGRQKDEEDY